MVEKFTWEKYKVVYQKERLLRQEVNYLKNLPKNKDKKIYSEGIDENDEKQIKVNLDTPIEPIIENEFLTQKESMHPDFFAATFYAMMNKNKKKYMLLASDQADYFFESMFVIIIQIIVCSAIWKQQDPQINFVKTFDVNLAMLFTTLVLHFSCIGTVRNGLNMCKFVVYHQAEFENPGFAFSLGVLTAVSNIFCSCTNIYQIIQQDSVVKVIQKFVAFKILI